MTLTTDRPPDTERAVSVDLLAKRYGEHDAITDVTFSVRRGAIVGFLGPNGAGKTTTLRLAGSARAGNLGRRAPAGHAEAATRGAAASGGVDRG
jgi:ABC-2 type transport system ATP-binding protein